MSTGSVPLLWERNFTSNGCIHVLARYRESMATHMLNIKRIYDNPADDDGYRILVDRIWPRGVSKERAKLDRWAKTEVTPTTDLRKWFAHDPAKFDEFKARYIEQLDSRPEAAQFVDDVRNLLHDANITLHRGHCGTWPHCGHSNWRLLPRRLRKRMLCSPRSMFFASSARSA